MTKLFVNGFPLESDEMALAWLIAPHGDITTIKIVRDRQTKKCKGYAFAEMATLTDAENAIIALDGLEMGDRQLTLKINEENPVAPKPRFNKPTTDSHRNSFNPKPMFSSESKPDTERAKRQRRPRV